MPTTLPTYGWKLADLDSVEKNGLRVMSTLLARYIIGMSVPPPLTETVARHVCQQWLA